MENNYKRNVQKTMVVSKKKEAGHVKLAETPAVKLTAHQQRKLEKKKKKMVWMIVFVSFIFVFFTFGFVSKFIFGPASDTGAGRITKIAEDNILAVINIVHLVENYIDIIIKSLSTIFVSLIIIVLLLIITRAIGNTGGNRRRTITRLVASFIKYIGAIVMLMIVLAILGVDAGTLLASVGILGLVIGLGAQSLISDILAGLFIVFENCFQVGDIITVGTFRGEVIDIGLRTTRVKDVVGDVMVVNNSELRSYINQSQHSSFAVCDVTIEYGENIEKVEKIIAASIAGIADKLTQITETPIYKGVAGFTERGVVLKIVARCDEINRIQLNRDLAREVKLLFDKHKIRIAVPKVSVEK
jgi:small conductance mechanosensitive channel